MAQGSHCGAPSGPGWKAASAATVARRHMLGHHARLLLHGLELAQRLAELHALIGMRQRELQAAQAAGDQGCADGGGEQAGRRRHGRAAGWGVGRAAGARPPPSRRIRRWGAAFGVARVDPPQLGAIGGQHIWPASTPSGTRGSSRLPSACGARVLASAMGASGRTVPGATSARSNGSASGSAVAAGSQAEHDAEEIGQRQTGAAVGLGAHQSREAGLGDGLPQRRGIAIGLDAAQRSRRGVVVRIALRASVNMGQGGAERGSLVRVDSAQAQAARDHAAQDLARCRRATKVGATWAR